MCSITLVNQNCFDYLKTIQDNSVSLVLIDPPYEVSRDTNFASGDLTGKDTDLCCFYCIYFFKTGYSFIKIFF